jgi:hypothetical protein
MNASTADAAAKFATPPLLLLVLCEPVVPALLEGCSALYHTVPPYRCLPYRALLPCCWRGAVLCCAVLCCAIYHAGGVLAVVLCLAAAQPVVDLLWMLLWGSAVGVDAAVGHA